MTRRIGIRWTIGDVEPAGFEALRLSVHGAMRLFGGATEYCVYVNTIPVCEARKRVGAVPDRLQWREASLRIPSFLRPCLREDMAEGVAWKLMPLRAFPGRFELALDNDVILWGIPPAIREWLTSGDPGASVIAPDVSCAFGKFASLCGPVPRNSGIRGLGPTTGFEAAIELVLAAMQASLDSELDEQGMQIAALERCSRCHVVDLGDVTICSPFYPHVPELGRFGAHFVGLNTRVLDWEYYGRPAKEVRLGHWMSLRKQLYDRVGLTAPVEQGLGYPPFEPHAAHKEVTSSCRRG